VIGESYIGPWLYEGGREQSIVDLTLQSNQFKLSGLVPKGTGNIIIPEEILGYIGLVIRELTRFQASTFAWK
jgi:hypothetical protein